MNIHRDRKMREFLRRVVIVLCCIAISGCQSFEAIGGTPPGLHDELRAGRLVKVGDTVRLTTRDGRHHEFIVQSIDQTTIAGRQTAIDIGEVERVEHEEPRAGRTGLLVVGGILAVLVGLISTADMGPN